MTKHLLKLREKAEQIGYLASLCVFFFFCTKEEQMSNNAHILVVWTVGLYYP